MPDNIADLFVAREWLLGLHAAAEGARNPKMLRRVRASLSAVDTVIAAMTPPPPARVRHSLRQPAPKTVPGDFRPTLYAPMDTVMEARQ